MMQLYSGTTCPFSHRCRFVLYEKGMDFQVIDVDLYNKPEDIAVMNPYNRLPVLVERDLILYESNIINEYIDERFPHPQLMPADPVMRARARLMLFNMEVELFSQIESLESGSFTATGYMAEKLFPFRGSIDVSSLDPGTYTFIVMTDDPSGAGNVDEDSRTVIIR